MLLMSNDDLYSVLEYRKIMEVGIIDIFMKKVTQKDIDYLKKDLEKMRYFSEKNNMNKYRQYDLDFHMRLYEMTDNPFIIKLSNITRDVINSAMGETLTEQGAEEGIDFHQKIIECLESRDGERLKKITEELLDAVEDDIDLYRGNSDNV